MSPLEQLAALNADAADMRLRRPVFYVAHPLRPSDADIENAWPVEVASDDDMHSARVLAQRLNLERAKRWLNYLRIAYPAICFMAPWITAIEAGADDNDPAQRAAGIADNVAIIGRCDGVVLCGGRVSSGMAAERDAATSVIDLTQLGPEPPR